MSEQEEIGHDGRQWGHPEGGELGGGGVKLELSPPTQKSETAFSNERYI